MPSHNFIDLTGQTYNWVFIESRAENNKCDQSMWNCICLLCGNRFVASGKNIRNGRTKSCGCYRRQVARERMLEDLTGQTFQNLFVKHFSHSDKYGNSIWECECLLCGNTTYASTAELKSGHRKACGCTRAATVREVCMLDLKDKQCGWLMTRYPVGSKDNQVLWYCDCINCGGNAVVPAHLLASGGVTSCGCIKSRGERRIHDFLNSHNIRYQKQKRFIGCKNVYSLMFDVYLPDYNIAIEYDGPQHYKDVPYWDGTGDLSTRQYRDEIKTKYCEENDIILLRIPYWEKDNIESILNDWLFLNDGEEANSSTDDLSA